MKYYYLFILITLSTTAYAVKGITGRSELNSAQEKQFDCLIITSQDEEKAVINKAERIAGTAYYIGEMFDKVTPMAVNDQFVIPVRKYGIPGKEPEYDYHNESLS